MGFEEQILGEYLNTHHPCQASFLALPDPRSALAHTGRWVRRLMAGKLSLADPRADFCAQAAERGLTVASPPPALCQSRTYLRQLGPEEADTRRGTGIVMCSVVGGFFSSWDLLFVPRSEG